MTRMKLYQYDDGEVGNSNLTSITDALERVTTFGYDFRGRLETVGLPDPDDDEQTNNTPAYGTTYDNLGRVKTQTDPHGWVTDYDYNLDTTNHLLIVTVTLPDPDGSSSGQPRPVIVDTYEARGLLISHVDANENETRYGYDGAGRLVSVTQVYPNEPGLSQSTTYEYDDAGNLTKIIDPLENETEREYDALNRLTDVYEPDPDGPSNPLERPHTEYNYDAAGRLLSLTDPVGNATTWYYDALGRIKQEVNQVGHSRHFEYDAASRLISRTDRLGRRVEFDYNELDQVRHEYWYEGPTLVRTLTFDYDDAGQLAVASDPAAAYTYLPDRLGRLETHTQAIDGLSEAIEYVSQYNKAGSRTNLTAAIGTTLDFENVYGYDYLQRLASLNQQGQTGSSVNTVAEKRVDFGYNAGGQFTSLRRFHDLAGTESVANTFYDYDPLGRLESLIHTLDAEAPTSGWGTDPLAGYVYVYDGGSRIWSISSMVDGLIEYGYDATNQLKSAGYTNSSLADESYSYDENGNRTGGGYETGLNNQLASDGTYNYLYDAEGNRIRRTKISDGTYTNYSYDHRNRLIRVVDIEPSGTYGTDWGWGATSDSASVALPTEGGGSGFGWGASSGGGYVVHNEPCGSEGFPECESSHYTASVTSAAEGGSVKLTITHSNESSFTVLVLVEAYFADDEDYTASDQWVPVLVSAETGAEFLIPTVADAIEELTESFKIHLSYSGAGGTILTLEADIFDAVQAEFSAAAAPAIEGDDVLLVVTAVADLDFEYWVEDVSALVGTHYGDPGSSSSSNWVAVPSNWQLALPTYWSSAEDNTRSFKIHVRPVGHPDSEVVLEADIYDRETVAIQTVDYAYDVYNQLVRRTLDADGPTGATEPVSTFFSWEAGQIVLQFEGNATNGYALAHRYLFNPVAVDQLFADENAANEVLWALNDHLGTPRDLVVYDETEDEGVVVNHRFYDSFGRLLDPGTGPSMVFGFTGVLADDAIGLNYHRNRWFDPTVGQWLNEDPKGFAAGDMNLNRYVGNSPTNLTDPSGLEPPGSMTLRGDPIPIQIPAWRLVNTAKVAKQRCLVNVVIYDVEDAKVPGWTSKFQAMLNKGTYKQDIAIPVTKGMSITAIFTRLRRDVGPYKISDLYFWDHGVSQPDAYYGQSIGNSNNWLKSDDFRQIADLFVPQSMIHLYGCGLGAPGYKRYRWEIAQATGAPVRANSGWMEPNGSGGPYSQRPYLHNPNWGRFVTTWPTCPEPSTDKPPVSDWAKPYQGPAGTIPPWDDITDDDYFP